MVASGQPKPAKNNSEQALVQLEKVGFYPLNSLAFSAVYHTQAHVLLGRADDPLAQTLRPKSSYTLQKQELDITGKVFSGFSDAFYRGKLPELLIITTAMQDLPHFIDEWLDYVEKLVSLGFVAQISSELDDTAWLNRYIPQMILATYGIAYDVVYDKLKTGLNHLKDLPDRLKERMLQKLTRGVWTSPGAGYDLSLNTPVCYSKALSLNLAGAKTMFSMRTTQLLDSAGITYNFNPNGASGILELEMTLAFQHMMNRTLPALSIGDLTVFSTPAALTAQKLGILSPLTLAKPEKTSKEASNTVGPLDMALCFQWTQWAAEANQPEFQAWLVEQLESLKSHLTVSTASGSSHSVD